MPKKYTNFNYLDHLENIEIDTSSYLSLFSDTNYTLKFSNTQPTKINLKNFFSKIDFIEGFKDKSGAFVEYNIREGELPEDVSLKFYDTVDFWWIITLYNSIKNPFQEWFLTNDQINTIATLYSNKQNIYSKEGYIKLLNEKNLANQKIDVLRREYIQRIILAYQNSIFTVNESQSKFEISV